MEAQRVYHFINRGFGLDDLRRRRLKVATIEDLNDPFELRGMAVGDARIRAGLASWRREMSRTAGLLCFSTSWRNPVQWSHYADKHTGICLGFDFDGEFLKPVEYRAKLHSDFFTAPDAPDESTIMRLLSTKYAHWRYEREVRAWIDLASADREGDLYFHSFGREMRLAEVIVGAQSTITRAELAEALGPLREAVVTFKARLAFKSFRVVRQRKHALWA